MSGRFWRRLCSTRARAVPVTHYVRHSYRDAAPYVVAYVELNLPDGGPGPRVMTNVVDCDPGSVAVGDRVEAVFHPTERGVALVRFRPA